MWAGRILLKIYHRNVLNCLGNVWVRFLMCVCELKELSAKNNFLGGPKAYVWNTFTVTLIIQEMEYTDLKNICDLFAIGTKKNENRCTIISEMSKLSGVRLSVLHP